MKKELTKTSWPRHLVKSIETRKRDIVVRIADWTHDRDEPAFDVEVYERGVYDWNKSKCFTTKNSGHTKAQAAKMASDFASKRIAELLCPPPNP